MALKLVDSKEFQLVGLMDIVTAGWLVEKLECYLVELKDSM